MSWTKLHTNEADTWACEMEEQEGVREKLVKAWTESMAADSKPDAGEPSGRADENEKSVKAARKC